MQSATDLQSIVTQLHAEQESQQRGEISPVEFARRREDCLVRGLSALSASMGVPLRGPMRIDANGEISIIAEEAKFSPACGQYGPEFASILSKFSPRTGSVSTSYITPENGWCKMNHFNVEKMLSEAIKTVGIAGPNETNPMGHERSIDATPATNRTSTILSSLETLKLPTNPDRY